MNTEKVLGIINTALVSVLILVLGYFGTKYIGKIETMETTVIPSIQENLKDQKTILLALITGAKPSLAPELKEFLDKLIKASVTSAVRTNLGDTARRADLLKVKNEVQKLSSLVEKQQNFAALSWIAPYLAMNPRHLQS